MSSFKVILWDFDGVLLDSNSVRELGFRIALGGYPDSEVESLLAFHRLNGGLSRYVKFRHFFETIRNESLSSEDLERLCSVFSRVMLDSLGDPELLIPPTVSFVKKNFESTRMHVVSGSDQHELRQLCRQLSLTKYFVSIHGSPTPKSKLVEELMEQHQYNQQETILIGDSINDFSAAMDNGIHFLGFEDEYVVSKSTVPLDTFGLNCT